MPFSSLVTTLQSRSSRIRTSTHCRALTLGCAAAGAVGVLWLPGSAQNPAIVPDAAPAMFAQEAPPLPEMTNSARPKAKVPAAEFDTAAVPAPASSVRAAAKRDAVRINLEFRDVPVTELLMMIAGEGDVAITIGSDVEVTTKVPYIRLNNVTAEQAIRQAAMSANLRWHKADEKSYFVGKTLPSELETRTSEPNYQPTTPRAIEAIDPNWLNPQFTNRGNSTAALPSLSSGYGNSAGTGYGNSGFSNGLIPLHQQSQRQERQIRPIRIRNVRSGLLAWWIDPKRQPMPIEMQASNQAQQQAISPNRLIPAVDPNIMATLNGRSSPMMPFTNPYAAGAGANPYVNPGAANPWMQPVYRSNYLFGGGGGGNQFGGGGGNQFGGGGGGGFGGGGGVLEIGQDDQGRELVDQIVSIDAQNVLLVYGTEEGIRRLQTIIEFLDRPIRQVEIESQFIDISVSDAKAFGIQFFNRGSLEDQQGDDDDDDNNNNNNPVNALGTLPGVAGANAITITRGLLQARVQALTSTGRARIINSPRVTTMNNLTASLVSQQQTPVVLTSSSEGIGGQVGETQNAFFLTTSIGIQVTPTINNDDTITVFLTPQVSIQLPTPTLGGGGGGGGDDDDSNSSTASSIPTVSSQFVTTVANVKDNDVIVLGGLRTRTQNIVRSRIPILSKIPLIGRLFRSQNVTDIDRELVIFLTARILRRTDDVTPIQGP